MFSFSLLFRGRNYSMPRFSVLIFALALATTTEAAAQAPPELPPAVARAFSFIFGRASQSVCLTRSVLDFIGKREKSQ
jgi:hypothetical protein